MFDYYLDMIETARRALQHRDAARREFDETLRRSSFRRPDELPRRRKPNDKGPDGEDGPETWPGLFA